MTIYRLSAYTSEDRCDWLGSHPNNKDIDWLAIGDFLEKLPDAPKEYIVANIIIDHRHDALAWDYYTSHGLPSDFFSKKFMDVLKPEELEYFSIWPVLINNVEYYTLSCEKFIDCLDYEKSDFDLFFPERPDSRIMRYNHHVFMESKTPTDKFFMIPDHNILFVPELIADRITKAKLKGVEVMLLP